MKKLRSLQGGYPRQQDYLLTLQDELTTMADGLFAKLGVDMVLKGCELVNNGNGTVNIAAGIVYVSGEVIRFDGQSNVVANGSLAFVKGTAANTDAKLFADGQSREVYKETKAQLAAKSSNTQIAVSVAALYNLATYINDVVNSYAIKGEIKDIYDFDGTFLENFDSSGLGVTTRYNNWAILNGNNGTPDGKGRVRITAGTVTNPNGLQVVFNHSDAGGETQHKLTIAEMPSHNHNTLHEFIERGNSGSKNTWWNGNNSAYPTTNAGGDQAHNNLQPYLTVYTIIKIA